MDINKNDVVRIHIDDMSHEGLGVGKLYGMTVFVKDAICGDDVLITITKVKKNYCFARVKEIITPSEYRVQAKCPKALLCGGCVLQELDYKKQLELKQQIVINNLIRIGGFNKEELIQKAEPIIGMENPFRYRNKASVPVGIDKDGNIVMGYYGARSHRIVPHDDCIIGQEIDNKILDIIKRVMIDNNISAYDEIYHKGLIRHVLIRHAFATDQIMVCIVLNGASLPCKDVFISELSKISQIKSICINYNTANDNVILGKETKALWGQEYITDKIGDLSFNISANSFYQVNPAQMYRLYSKALEYASLTGKETVLDLYCGIGTISLFLAKNAGLVYGIEVVPQAVENAKTNASINNIDNAKFYLGKAEEILPKLYAKDEDQYFTHPDVIVVDPPRKGCDEDCITTMLGMAPNKIIYVSCDSATLSRDLKILCEQGYEIAKFTVVDQFCHSMHTETVVGLNKKK